MPSQEQMNGLNKLDKFQAQKTQELNDLSLRLLRKKELKQQSLPSIGTDTFESVLQESPKVFEELAKTTKRFTLQQIFGLFSRLHKSDLTSEKSAESKKAAIPSTPEEVFKFMLKTAQKTESRKLNISDIERRSHDFRQSQNDIH